MCLRAVVCRLRTHCARGRSWLCVRVTGSLVFCFLLVWFFALGFASHVRVFGCLLIASLATIFSGGAPDRDSGREKVAAPSLEDCFSGDSFWILDGSFR